MSDGDNLWSNLRQLSTRLAHAQPSELERDGLTQPVDRALLAQLIVGVLETQLAVIEVSTATLADDRDQLRATVSGLQASTQALIDLLGTLTGVGRDND